MPWNPGIGTISRHASRLSTAATPVRVMPPGGLPASGVFGPLSSARTALPKVSGMVAVMAINEKLLQALLEKNPYLSFAVQESDPMKGTYADAIPLGPLMELRAQNDQNTFTAERATLSLDYWRATAQNVLADPEASG